MFPILPIPEFDYFFPAAMVEDLSDNAIADYREAFSAFDKVDKLSWFVSENSRQIS